MAYIDAIKELENKLFAFDPQAEKIYSLINDLKAFIPKEPEAAKKPEKNYIKLVFDKNAPATEQIVFALKYLNQVSKASDIVSAIKEFDPTFDKGLSTPFYKLKEAGIIQIFNPSISNENPTGSNHSVYYGLKDWFVGENKVREEYIDDFITMIYGK